MAQCKRPNQKDVARIAGVSQTTVSQILNPRSGIVVSADTRQRVRDAIDEVGYVPNRAARSLRTSKTYTIAYVCPDLTNPFYPTVLSGAQAVLEAENYEVIVYSTGRERRASENASCRSAKDTSTVSSGSSHIYRPPISDHHWPPALPSA